MSSRIAPLHQSCQGAAGLGRASYAVKLMPLCDMLPILSMVQKPNN